MDLQVNLTKSNKNKRIELFFESQAIKKQSNIRKSTVESISEFTYLETTTQGVF